jgi:hypothetical protein
MSAFDHYWRLYDVTLGRIRDEKPDTFDALKAILDRFHPPSSGDAFFPGGADDTLADALRDAGWAITWREGDYLWDAHHPLTGAKVEHVEGDLYDRTRAPAPTTYRVRSLEDAALPSSMHATTPDNIEHIVGRVVELVSEATGEVVGTIGLLDGELSVSGVAVSMRATEHGRALSAHAFFEHYRAWSNGYITSRNITKEQDK